MGDKEKQVKEKKKKGKYVSTWKDGELKSENKVLPDWVLVVVSLICVVSAIGVYYLLKTGDSKYSATQHAIIDVESVRETSLLEVLSISTKELIAESEKDNKDGITAWTEFEGKGVFVVDLAKSQFLVDEARNTVIVRTPKVKFSTDRFTIDYGKTKNLLFYNAGFNDNYLDGSNLYHKQLREAYVKMFNKLYTNPYYYKRAESAADKIISSLVKGFNSDNNDLQVFVEVGVL